MQDFRMETFLTVCRYMNFTKAAKELNLTQPAVSQHIHFLEKEYQVLLFKYKGKKVYLTEAGILLRNTALTMKHDESHLREKMKKIEDKKKHYVFGATLTIAEFVLPNALRKFMNQNKNTRIQMQVANTEELLKKLDFLELDFAIVEGDFPREEYDCISYKQEEFIAVGSPMVAERLDGKKLDDLKEEILIIRESGSGTRKIFEKALENRGMYMAEFLHVNEIGSIGAIKELVKSDMGITFLYQAAIHKEQEEGTLKKINLTDFSICHDFMFIFRKNSIFREDYLNIYEDFLL